MSKRIVTSLVLAFILGLLALFLALPSLIDRTLNVVGSATIQISDHARALHKSLTIVDLHADTLLWTRDLLIRNDRGFIDIPRLIEGNVGLQAFTIVTKVPRQSGFAKGVDYITMLAIVERWPMQAWSSLKERALYQATKLDAISRQSGGRLRIIKSAADLDDYLRRRAHDQACTAGFLGIEGAHALNGDLSNIDVLFDHGIRMMSPSHFFDNDIGGSSYGTSRYGLTTKGKEMIRRMQAKSIIVDLAHASSATIKDVLAISTKPVVVSHTGVKGTCDNIRNISDAEIIGIAKTGGVIGIGYWPQAVCGSDAKHIARAMRYTAKLVGIEHVALGSDFDGACSAPFDASGLVCLTQALIDEHFSDEEIRAIMGQNALRVLRSGLPAS